MQILVDKKNGGNIFNKNDLAEIATVNRILVENMTIPDFSLTKNYFYREICGIYCNESNALVIGFLQVKKI